jgi:hypothetical protein
LASRISFPALQRRRQARLLERHLALTLARYHITGGSIVTFVPSLQHHRSLLGQARKSSLQGVMFFQNAIACEVSPEPQLNVRTSHGKGVDLRSLEQGQLPVECKTKAVPDNDFGSLCIEPFLPRDLSAYHCIALAVDISYCRLVGVTSGKSCDWRDSRTSETE